MSMAGKKIAASSAEAALYASMAGKRVAARSAEATLYVSMAGESVSMREEWPRELTSQGGPCWRRVLHCVPDAQSNISGELLLQLA